MQLEEEAGRYWSQDLCTVKHRRRWLLAFCRGAVNRECLKISKSLHSGADWHSFPKRKRKKKLVCGTKLWPMIMHAWWENVIQSNGCPQPWVSEVGTVINWAPSVYQAPWWTLQSGEQGSLSLYPHLVYSLVEKKVTEALIIECRQRRKMGLLWENQDEVKRGWT